MPAGIGKAASSSTASNTGQVVALCYVHSVIGLGFFILQSWVPTYLSHLGMTDLKTVGALSALPWVVSLCSSCSAVCCYSRPCLLATSALCCAVTVACSCCYCTAKSRSSLQTCSECVCLCGEAAVMLCLCSYCCCSPH